MSVQYPRVVMLHDRNTGDFDRLRRNTDLELPISVVSLTDTDPKWNTHNDGNFDAFAGAARVFIQERLLNPPTIAARLALGCALESDDTRIGVFDADYNIRMIDRVTAQRMKSEAIS